MLIRLNRYVSVPLDLKAYSRQFCLSVGTKADAILRFSETSSGFEILWMFGRMEILECNDSRFVLQALHETKLKLRIWVTSISN